MMSWIFIVYLLIVSFIFYVFIYDDIKCGYLGVFDAFGALMLSMAWPFLLLMILAFDLEDWYYKKFNKEKK